MRKFALSNCHSLIIGIVLAIFPLSVGGVLASNFKGIEVSSRPPKLLNGNEISRMIDHLDSGKDDAGREAAEGEVSTEISVSSSGAVTDVYVVRSNGIKFSRAAIGLAKKMRFAPALKDSRPAASKVSEKFHFHFKDSGGPQWRSKKNSRDWRERERVQ